VGWGRVTWEKAAGERKWLSFSHLETGFSRLFPHESTKWLSSPSGDGEAFFVGGISRLSAETQSQERREPPSGLGSPSGRATEEAELICDGDKCVAIAGIA